MSLDVDLRGFRELDRMLHSLENKEAGRILTLAVNDGARLIRDEARAQVPVRTGRLKRAIRIFSKRTGVTTGVLVAIGVRGKLAHIMRFLEYGSASHRIVAKGKALDVVQVKSVEHPGQGPNAVLRRAFEGRIGQAVAAMKKRLREELAKIRAR